MAVASPAGGGGSAVPIFPGECVEIFGLSSAAGQELNGNNGIVTKLLENGRMEVRIGVDKRVTVKPDNLRLVQKDIGKVTSKLGFGDADRKAECEAAAMFREGDLIEVHSLDGMNREMNGKTGKVVVDWETPPDRVKVKLDMGTLMGKDNFRHATLKPANVKKVTMAGLTDEQREQAKALLDGGPGKAEESMQENVLRSQLNRLSAQERHSGTDVFTKVDLAVEAGGASSGSLRPGDVVEVSGLTSETGKQLNGDRGVVISCPSASEERAEVRLASGNKKLKPDNLKQVLFGKGDRFIVEVFGLQSESGKQLNGQRGIAVAKNSENGRLEVRFSKEKTVSLKPDNLKLLNKKK
mmetsp:Transcript_11544/g.26308  ORF Transcript_11544/g.26308 Transcript_11544/m.26308 type:complete len:353 (-) Transcript_11544:79-1137(-)|eukprot:CAMPEP_0197904382 /NCGR_PEP_ID=MMETSP1439-20131203/57951_1 /TAXON_ID=66791 /ORGANISM="Gonyaulax spinifera, Strain CCMP409" /LENGTH=352 /DNA_ID=CAMNT_0043525565 /DNA_START=33 /DNA_END=1091 /DNA_ORIENTATION=-